MRGLAEFLFTTPFVQYLIVTVAGHLFLSLQMTLEKSGKQHRTFPHSPIAILFAPVVFTLPYYLIFVCK